MMKRKIILNLAMSLDGDIADETGGYEWIVGDGNSTLDTDQKWSFDDFLESIDIVVMGKRCYEQDMHLQYPNKKVFVATSEELEDFDNIHFIKGDIVKLLIEEKQKEGKDIYLFGGGQMIDAFLKSDSIDEYIVGVIPTILGSGRPLFLENNPTINLKLKGYYVESGITILRYSKHKKR